MLPSWGFSCAARADLCVRGRDGGIPGEGCDMQEHPSAEFPCIGGFQGNLGPLQGAGFAGETMALQRTGVCGGRLEKLLM